MATAVPGGIQHHTVVFDLGGVLVDWNPRYLYRKLFGGNEAGMERFLAEVCTSEWNLQQDAGRSWTEATALLKREHPRQADLIDAYHQRWAEMIAGPIEATVVILRELKEQGTPLFALTNWSNETYPIARELFDFLGWFSGVVVSGEEKLVKPDPQIYRLLLRRYGLEPGHTIYIDDVARNVEAATALGMHGLRFTTPAGLRRDLVSLGLLRDLSGG